MHKYLVGMFVIGAAATGFGHHFEMLGLAILVATVLLYIMFAARR